VADGQTKKRILAVDDEEHMTNLISLHLRNAGYEVTVARDGTEALECLKHGAPDLIVLDIMMPIMDGWEVLKCVREDPEGAGVPVIMLTSRSQNADIARGWQEGVDSYLTKPFNPLELVSLVRRLIDEDDV
jgi:two-component system, OmpR family, alkaline phosphatase synthesis response regulator PhoP